MAKRDPDQGGRRAGTPLALAGLLLVGVGATGVAASWAPAPTVPETHRGVAASPVAASAPGGVVTPSTSAPAAAPSASVPATSPSASAPSTSAPSASASAPVLDDVARQWACPDDESSKGRSGWPDASAVDGAAVYVPTACAVAPMVADGWHWVSPDEGEDYKSLTLHEPPVATWFDATRPVGSTEGATLVASHAIAPGTGDPAERPSPFGRLDDDVEVGDPVFVRSSDGVVYQYEVTGREAIPNEALPSQEELFTGEGSPMLYLVTCGEGPILWDGEETRTAENFVVSARLLP